MEVRKLVEIDDEVYLAVVTEICPPGTDGAAMPFVRAFKLYRGGEEVALDALSDEAAYAIYCELDDKLPDAWREAEYAKERAEQRARWARIVNR